MSTPRRTAVREQLDGATEFLSAQEVHARLRATGAKVGLTTVYRALQAMTEAGEVDALRQGDGETVYRRCSTGRHHHHLVCRDCGRTVEVEGPAVERWAERVASDHGFRDIEHTLEVFGTCAHCPA